LAVKKIIEKIEHNVDALRHQVFRVETEGSYGDVPDQRMKEAARRFLFPFARARGYLPHNPSASRDEIKMALREWESSREYVSQETYEHIRTILIDIDELLGKQQVADAITKMQTVWDFMMRRAFAPPRPPFYIASPFPEGVPVETKGCYRDVPEYLTVYRGQSDVHHSDVLNEGIKPSESQTSVYTTIEFRQAVRFAWAHTKPLPLTVTGIKKEVGKPIVYRMSVPVSFFTGQVVYPSGPTGFLMSGPIPRQYIIDWVSIPDDIDEVWKLEDKYAAEENTIKTETLRLVDKIPKVYYQHHSAPTLPVEIEGSTHEGSWVQIPPGQYYSSGFHVRYIDQSTGKTVEKDISSREQFDLYRLQREGKISIISIKPASSNPDHPALELKQQFGSVLKAMIEEGEREDREVGAMLCRNTSTGGVHLSRTCWGRRGGVIVADCHDGLAPLGSYHVHLRGSDVFSPQDLEQALEREQLSCIGYMKAGVPMLKCILPSKYYEYTPEIKTKIRTELKETAIIMESKRSPEEVYRKLYDLEQLLGANVVQL